VIVLPAILAAVVFVIVLVAEAFPTPELAATPPVAIDTWPAPTLTCDESVLATFTLTDETFEPAVIEAVVGSVMALMTVEPPWDDELPTDPPAATAVIVSPEVAETDTVPVCETVVLLMEAVTEF
jgi:hypothetical protein